MQLENKPHRILRLEDSDGDGRFDSRTVFADRMMFPEGTLWFAGSLYVAAPPSIWKLTDTDGDGVADRREEWFQGKTLTGCANDLHGPYLGPDGWIYWCKGAFAEQTYERPGRAPFVTKASHIFRSRPDNSAIEPVMTGGMDNPVDVVFTPGGERIFTTTFLQQPGGGRRDGLIHAVYGGVYGKVNPVVDGHKRTSPELMPVVDPPGTGRTLRADDVRVGRLRPRLPRQPVRRPVQPAEDHAPRPRAGWCDLHDPRLRLPGLEQPRLPPHRRPRRRRRQPGRGRYRRLVQALLPDLAALEARRARGHLPRRRVARQARTIPAAGGSTGRRWSPMRWGACSPTRGRPSGSGPSPRSPARGRMRSARWRRSCAKASRRRRRRNAVWAATRIDLPDARDMACVALGDADETTRQAAIHSVSLWRDFDALPQLLRLEQASCSGQNMRAAAEAIGRIGPHAGFVVKDLLNAAGCSPRILARTFIDLRRHRDRRPRGARPRC